jgi:cytidylate kinase
MAVITISRQTGSGGDEIAALVCKQLGYRYFDKAMLAKAASEDTQSEVDFLKFSEEDFVKGSRLTDRLLAALRSAPDRTAAQMRIWTEDSRGQRSAQVVQLDQSRAIQLVQNAIRYVAEQGNVVIMGRGAQVILKDHRGALHVRIEAPWEDRVQRVKQRYDLRGEGARTEAQNLIARRDEASADYVRRFYDVNIKDAQLYHLVINTGKLSVEAAADLIATAAKAVSA